jgi:hypothetical protein
LFHGQREGLSGTCCCVELVHGRLWAGSWVARSLYIKEIGYGKQ